MANLSIKLNLLPGITRNIDLTLDDLLASFNSEWSLEDRLELIMGLNLESADNTTGVRALAKIFNGLDVGSLTVSQLIILDNTIKDFKSEIDNKKEEIIKSREN